ncbi:hypothetical protein HF086_013797 [Spodoptera exigua]|uniref:Uncharacterized protein n=1 Tax=Spodoptera exigua TaxID=7107 RepID=A0A922MB02_SPOEX|nr:hypothetical protein HF086_013797 [Spodoptera exigua]
MQEAALPSTSETNVHLNLGKNILPAECKDTADLLLFMDNIFDSVNGSRQKNRNAKPLLGPATPNSAHHQIWIEGVQIFKSMKFVSNGKKQSVPSITNWVWTLSRINKLQNEFNVSSVWLRHLNQDPLENFFGAGIRRSTMALHSQQEVNRADFQYARFNQTKENIEKLYLKLIINTAVSSFVDFTFIKCIIEKKIIDFLINIVIRFIIFNYCKNINIILAGRKDVDDDENKLQVKAKKLSEYYRKNK